RKKIVIRLLPARTFPSSRRRASKSVTGVLPTKDWGLLRRDTTMPQALYCPGCQAEVAADAPHGLCPACLFQRIIEGRDEAEEPTAGQTPPAGFVPPAPAELGQHFPQLEMLALLGQGGMGAVYKARQTKLDRLVAVKILPPEVARDPAFAERFTRE